MCPPAGLAGGLWEIQQKFLARASGALRVTSLGVLDVL
jgi:hypothetical protein